MAQPPYFYRIQHAGASDSMPNDVWVLPPSRTRYDPEKGLAPALEMEQPYERRINKECLENALDPMSKQHTGMIALYDNYEQTCLEKDYLDSSGALHIKILHISTSLLERDVLTLTVTPPNEMVARQALIPVLRTEGCEVVVFPLSAVKELFDLQSEDPIEGIWMALEPIPKEMIVRVEVTRRQDGRINDGFWGPANVVAFRANAQDIPDLRALDYS